MHRILCLKKLYFQPGGSLTLLGVVNHWRKRHIRWNTFETSICTRPRPQNAKRIKSEQLPVCRYWFSGPLSSVSLSGDLGRGAACPRGPSRVDTLSRAKTFIFAGRLFRCFTICHTSRVWIDKWIVPNFSPWGFIKLADQSVPIQLVPRQLIYIRICYKGKSFKYQSN